MTVIRRAYNPQTRDFKPLSGNTGGVVNDSNSTTIIVDFPKGYLDDKDAFIAFNVINPETNQSYWYDFSTGSIAIPYEVTSKVDHNKLGYQLILIGKTNPNYVEQSAVDTAMFMRSIMDYQQTDTSIVPAAVELTMLRYALEQRVKALEDAIAGGVVPVVPDDPDPPYFLMSYKNFYGDMEGLPVNNGPVFKFREVGDRITLADIQSFADSFNVTEENKQIIGLFPNLLGDLIVGNTIMMIRQLPSYDKEVYLDENGNQQEVWRWMLPYSAGNPHFLTDFTQYDIEITSINSYDRPEGTVTLAYMDEGTLVTDELSLKVRSPYGGVLTYTDDVGIIYPSLLEEDPRMETYETSYKFKFYLGQGIEYYAFDQETGLESIVQSTVTQSMLTDNTFRMFETWYQWVEGTSSYDRDNSYVESFGHYIGISEKTISGTNAVYTITIDPEVYQYLGGEGKYRLSLEPSNDFNYPTVKLIPVDSGGSTHIILPYTTQREEMEIQIPKNGTVTLTLEFENGSADGSTTDFYFNLERECCDAMGILFIDDGNGYYTAYPFVGTVESPDSELTPETVEYNPRSMEWIISLQNKKVDFPPPVYEFDPEYSGGGGWEEYA